MERIDKKRKILKIISFITVLIFIILSVVFPIAISSLEKKNFTEKDIVYYFIFAAFIIVFYLLIGMTRKNLEKKLKREFADGVLSQVRRSTSSFDVEEGKIFSTDDLDKSELSWFGLQRINFDETYYFEDEEGKTFIMTYDVDKEKSIIGGGYFLKKKISNVFDAKIIIKLSDCAFDLSNNQELEAQNQKNIKSKDGSKEIYVVESNFAGDSIVSDEMKNIFIESWEHNKQMIDIEKEAKVVSRFCSLKFEVVEMSFVDGELYIKMTPLKGIPKTETGRLSFENKIKVKSEQIKQIIEISERITKLINNS